MDKYEKIIIALRLCSAVNSSCEECPANEPADDLCECSNKVSIAAADAIENLLAETAALRRQIDNLTSAQAAMVDQFNTKLEELHETKSERDEYYTRLKGLCFCCGRREDPNFDCHTKCFGHQRGSAWIYKSAKSAAEAKE